MKTINYKKRRKNGIITTIIILLIGILIGLAFNFAASLITSTTMYFIFCVIFCFIAVFVLPGPIFKLQGYIYNYLNKNINVIEQNLSSEYRTIYLNDSCLKKKSIPLHANRIYMAKLNNSGTINIKIVNNSNPTDNFEERTSDYSWFLSMFRFEN